MMMTTTTTACLLYVCRVHPTFHSAVVVVANTAFPFHIYKLLPTDVLHLPHPAWQSETTVVVPIPGPCLLGPVDLLN